MTDSHVNMAESHEPVTDGHSRHYIKSSRSGGSGGNCVEWAHTPTGVSIRDSKNPDGPVLTFTFDEWRAFLSGAKDGEFDAVS
jgi:hypothetical protein